MDSFEVIDMLLFYKKKTEESVKYKNREKKSSNVKIERIISLKEKRRRRNRIRNVRNNERNGQREEEFAM